MVNAASFKPTNKDGTPVTKQQEQDLELAIQYLSRNEDAAKLLEQAAKNGVTIQFYTEKNGAYYPKSNHIAWNPEFSIGVKNGADTGYTSPALVLLHEIVHSVDKQNTIYYANTAKDCPQGLLQSCQVTNDPVLLAAGNIHEKLAVETERKIGQQLGEPTQLLYSDVIGDLVAVSPLDSNRKYYQNGQYHESEFKGHTKDNNGSIYTQKTTIYDNDLPTKIPLKKETVEYDDGFKPISKNIAIYDYKQGTITTTVTDYQNLDEHNQPKVSQNITTLDGKPIQSQDEGQTLTPIGRENRVLPSISSKHQKFIQQCEDKLVAICHERGITADSPQDFKNIAAAIAAKGITEQGMDKVEKATIDGSNFYIGSYSPYTKIVSVNVHEAVNIPVHESMEKIQQSEQQTAQKNQERQMAQEQNQGRSMV